MEPRDRSRRAGTASTQSWYSLDASNRPYSSLSGQRTEEDGSSVRPDSTLMDGRAKKQQQEHRSSGCWNGFKRLIKDTWLLEVTSLFLSMLATLAIILGLRLFDRRPSKEWTYWMTPNKTISIFSTIARTTLLLPIASGLGQLKWLYYKKDRTLIKFQTLDGASRGPFGSAILLCTLWDFLAVLGALLTICALAYEPMTQFALHFQDKSVGIWPGTATIPRSQAFRNNCLVNGTNGQKEIDIGMKMAMSSGLYYSNYSQTSMAIRPTCSTGTCDFDAYGSLSLCSQCTDVSHLVQDCVKLGIEDCSYRLPNGLTLTTVTDSGLISQGQSRMNSTTCDKLNVNTYDPIRSVVANFSIIGQTQDPTACKSTSGGSYGNISPTPAGTLYAYDCVMSFCVERFEASVNESIFSENINATFYDTTSAVQDALAPSHDTVIVTPDTWLPRGADTNFTVQKDNVGAVASYLKNLLEGNVTDNCNPVYSSDHINALWSSGLNNIPNSISNLAKSATNSIRTLNATESVVGRAKQWTVMIDVQYRFLSFALVLEVLTFVFLLFTMEETSAGKVPMWKSSVLASMIHGADPADMFAEIETKLDRTSEIEDYAEKKVVRLTLMSGRQGYQLVGT